MDNSQFLSVENLYKTYYNKVPIPVLKGVDLTVVKGELLAVIGASGSGKSTLLHLLGLLDTPTEGRVILDGEDIFTLDEKKRAEVRNRSIGFVFQFHYLLPEFDALENVMIPALIGGERDREKLIPSAQRLLTEVGLEERIYHKPTELSGGEQQRVALARALINRPSLVLADEPTGNLDRVTSEAVYDLMRQLVDTKEVTFIVATHDETLSSRADRVFRLVDGKLEVER